MSGYICNNCGNGSFTDFLKLPVAGTTDDYKASAFKSNGEQLVKCGKCGLVSIHPLPDEKAVLDGYIGAIDKEYVSQIKNRLVTFKKCLEKIETITGLENARVLDIGAGAGAFVKVAKDKGWHAEGIEPCEYLVKWGMEHLGLTDMYAITLDGLPANISYDVVTLWDVLEHMTNPNDAIFKLKTIVADDGYVVLNLPDISSSIPKLMGPRWPFYASCHIFYYTPQTIDYLMNKHGFELKHKENHYQELSLGYLAYRFEQFSPNISKLAVRILKKLKWSEIPIKYWIGQTLYVYKKA